MQSRGADERPTRLSLLPVVRDLDEAVAGQPVVPPGPQSQMEWDEEVAPPRAQNKVRQRVREVMYHRKVAAAAAVQQVNSSDVNTSEHGPSIPVKEKRQSGSVRNARIGVEKRRNHELSSLRAYDELMLPVAFAHQRALPKKIIAKNQQQETSWPKKLKEKASARSLKSKTSFPGLKKPGGSSSSLRQSANSLETPGQSPAFAKLPPVPPIPMQYVEGFQESIVPPSPFGSANMPALGVDARVRPSTTKKRRKTPPQLDISPFLAYENLAPRAATPMTPSPRLMPNLSVPGSTTTLNTLRTSPSREFPSGPEDPFWDEAVARVKATVRRNQEQERLERKASAKAEQQVIRNISKYRDGRLKWAKLTIEGLVGKYDEHGWLPKKDPKDFDDEDWTFVLEVLNHKDTKALRDRLFKKPEWIEADKARREKYEEEMRANPTPEYLAAQKKMADKERKEYGFRKILGLLTAEELEAERQKDSPSVGLGISSATESATPLMVSTTKIVESTDRSRPSEGTNEPEYRGRHVNRSEHEETPSKHKGHKHGISSVARRSVEQMTGVFNTESFNPRLSILGSEEIKQYIEKNPPIGRSPPTPTPDHSHLNPSLDPRQGSEPGSYPGLWLSSNRAPAQRLRLVKKAASSSDLIEEYNRQQFARTGVQPSETDGSPRLPALGIHPALRTPENATVSTASTAAGSQISRLRKAASSVTPLNSSEAPGSISGQVVVALPPGLTATPPLRRPPKPRKPSTAVKLPGKLTATAKPPSKSSITAKDLPSDPSVTTKPPSKPTTTVKAPRKPASTPPSSASRLSPVHELQEAGVDTSPKPPPLVRKPSTSVKSPGPKASSCSQSSSDTQLQPPSYSCPSPSATIGSQRSAVSSHSQSSGQPMSLPPPLKHSRPSPSAAAGFFDRFSSDARLAYSPLPLSYSRPSPFAAVGSVSQSPPHRQPASSPVPLGCSRPAPTDVADSYDEPSPDRQHVPTPLLLNYTRPSPRASDGAYIQSPPFDQPVLSPQSITYAVLPPRPDVQSSNKMPPGRQPASSPQQLGYSDSQPSTAVIPFATFATNNGVDEHQYELYAPIPLPDHLPPRSMARLSRVPTFPDASDFLAAMEDEPEPDGPYELPATPVRSSTPVRATTPMDRLNVKRSGIPVTAGSNVSDAKITNARGDHGTASFSPSSFSVGPYFLPAPTSLQPIQKTGQKEEVSLPLHNVGPNFLSESVSLQSVSTTGQKEESSPILNVGPYFPPGPVTFGLDQSIGEKRDEPTQSHKVSLHFTPGQLTFQPHQTTGLKRKEPVMPTHVPNVPNDALTPRDVAVAEWRNYQGKEPLVQYRGDRFETMVHPSGIHKSTVEQAQGQSRQYGSHFEIMVDSSSTICLPEQTQKQSQQHGNHFEIMVDCSDSHQLTMEQSKASVGCGNIQLPTTPHVRNQAVAENHMKTKSPSAQSSHSSKGELMSKQLRFASSSPGREQQYPPSPALPLSKIPTFRSFSDKNPVPSPRQPVTPAERSISLGGPQSGSPFTRNDDAMSNASRLAKEFESMKYNVPATAPLREGRFESFTPTKIRSPPADGSSTPISTRSRLRNKFSNVFHTGPVEQYVFGQDQQSTGGIAGVLNVNIEDVISAWQSSSPVPVQSPTPAPSHNQEIQMLRSEIGLEPICGHVLGEQKHPNHSYCWDTKKIMCRRIHNQGFVLPSLPSPAPHQKAHMADRSSELFVGSPYTDEPAGAQRCASCNSCCCQFAELSTRSKEPTKNDIVALNKCRQAEETVTSLRAGKPNGVEEWDSFLTCSQCGRSYCPDCIRLCREVLCQQPVCMGCVESTELCPIHNMF